MLYKFDTDDLKRAEAALLLYAIYRSRDDNSPISGPETWERFNTFTRSACLKSNTTAEFVQELCRKAKVNSIKPKFLDTNDPIKITEDGDMVVKDYVHDYRLGVIEDEKILTLYRNESIYLIMLVRDRVQRERIVTDGGAKNE